MGRVIEKHPGRDGYVRVVSLKTQNNIIKRPINKLTLLPIHDATDQEPALGPDDGELDTKTAPAPLPRSRRQRPKCNFTHLVSMAMLLFMALVTPVVPSAVQYNFTTLSENQGLYFDRISDLQHIRDEWKIIIYYNMTTYWQGMSDIEGYIKHLEGICGNNNAQYKSIMLQLKHDANELEHFNSLLNNQHTRQRRGLVNGIGYIANSLFGVLDERFAEKYKKDIELVAKNEQHLLSLIKNQTHVIESEYNILRRNEETMSKQFAFIKDHMRNLTLEMNQVVLVNQHSNYITASAIVANMILSNLRRIQQTLIHTVTDVSHGRIDTHLFPPEQLEEQVNFIQGQLNGELTLPTDKYNIRQLYKMLKVFARVTEGYLIMEVRVPLVSNELYELDQIITVPRTRGGLNQHIIIPTFPFIAFNLKKDMVIFLSHTDLQTCINTQMDRLLCTLEKPIYDMKIKNSICDIKLVNIASINKTPCSAQLSVCVADQWLRLHRQNSWLYSCCRECKVRIFCPAGMEIKTVIGNGIVTLGQGCTIKGDGFTMYSHNNFFNHVEQQPDVIDLPKISMLNNVINTSMTLSFEDPTLPKTQQKTWDHLKTEIDELKENSSLLQGTHDVYHYSLLCTLLGALVLMGGISLVLWRRWKQLPSQPPQPAAALPAPAPLPRAARTPSVQSGTSPSTSPIKFNVPV